MRFVNLTFLLVLMSCSTPKVKVKYKPRPKRISTQAKIVKCADFFMATHGVSLEAASKFCIENYRR